MIRSRAVRYGFGVAAAALAILLRLALPPVIGEDSDSYTTLFAALVIVGAYAGLGPAVACLAVGSAGVWYFLLAPADSFVLPHAPDTLGLLVNTAIGAGCAVLGNRIQHARQRAEAFASAARASEEQLASMFNVSHVGMAQASAGPFDRRILRANRAFCAMTGYDEAELQTMTIDEFTHPDDRARDVEAYERVAGGENAYQLEKRYLRKDGGTVWVQVNGNIVRDEDGRPVRSFAVVHDITRRKRAEAQRAEALARLDAVVRHAPIGIALFDADLRFIAINEGVTAIDGIAGDEHLGKTLSEVLPEMAPLAEPHLRRVRDTGEPAWNIEVSGETPALPGVKRYWSTNFFPVTDGSAGIRGIGATAVEVTKRHQAEQALRDSEQRFRTMADSTPVMIWVTDAHGNIEFVNRAFCAFFGLSEAQVSGPGAWHALLHPDDRAGFVERFMRAVRDRTDLVAEVRVRHANGTWRWIISHGAPRFAEDGTFLGHVGSSPDITLRKEAEEALRLKEAHLELLSSTVPALISYIDPEYRYRSCNKAYTTILGLDRDTLIGRHVRDVAGEYVWQIVRPRLEAALRGETVEYEAETTFPNGDKRWMKAVYTPHRDDRGKVIGIITLTTDITTLKHAEQALRTSEERFRVFMENSPARAWLKDEEGRYVFVNRATLLGHGLSMEDLIGRSDAELMPPAQAEQFRANDAAVRRSGAPLEVMETMPADDGEHYLLSVKFPVPGPDGRMFVGGMALDVTRQKHAEQAVIESEQRFRTMAEVSPVPIWVTGTTGRIEFVNRAYRQFFGLTDEQVRTKGGWETLIHPEDRPTYVDPFMRAVRERTPFAAECRVRHADGHWRWIATSAAPRFSANGEFLGHVGSSPDVTQLKHAEESLKEADRRKDEFLAIVAHELRSPLSPMRTGLEALRRAPDKSAALDRIRPIMERQVAQMVRIIEDLLDISRVTSGTIHLDQRPTSLAEIVHDAVEANRAAIEDARLELSVHVPDRPCLLNVDAARFVQVLSNLLANAAKFTDAGGRIDVIASIEEDATGPRVSIAVRDTGIGIPAAILPHLFDLFVKGDSGDRSRKGLGIGLALSRRLVDMLGGRLEVSSEGAGRGSTFTIKMPMLPASAGDAPAQPEGSRPHATQP